MKLKHLVLLYEILCTQSKNCGSNEFSQAQEKELVRLFFLLTTTVPVDNLSNSITQ